MMSARQDNSRQVFYLRQEKKNQGFEVRFAKVQTSRVQWWEHSPSTNLGLSPNVGWAC